MLRNPSMTTMNFLAKGSLGESLQLLIKVGDPLPIGFAYGKKGEITPAQQKHYDYMADKNKNRSDEEKNRNR